MLPVGFTVESGLCLHLLRQRTSLAPRDTLGIRLGSTSELGITGVLIKEAALPALLIPTLQMALTGSCDPHPYGRNSLPGTWTYSKKLHLKSQKHKQQLAMASPYHQEPSKVTVPFMHFTRQVCSHANIPPPSKWQSRNGIPNIIHCNWETWKLIKSLKT